MNKYYFDESVFYTDSRGLYYGKRYMNKKDKRGSNNVFFENCASYGIDDSQFYGRKSGLQGRDDGKGDYIILSIHNSIFFLLGIIKDIVRDSSIKISRQEEKITDIKRSYDSRIIEPTNITMQMYFFHKPSLKTRHNLFKIIKETFVDGRYKGDRIKNNGVLFIKFPDVVKKYKEDVYEEVVFTGMDIVEEYKDGVLVNLNFKNPSGMKIWIETRDTSKDYKRLKTSSLYRNKPFDTDEAFYQRVYHTENDLIEIPPPSFSLKEQKPDIYINMRGTDSPYCFFSVEKFQQPNKDFKYLYSTSGILKLKPGYSTPFYISIEKRLIGERRSNKWSDKISSLLNKNPSTSFNSDDSRYLNSQASYFSFDSVCPIQWGQDFHIVPAIECVLLWKNYIL